MVRFYFETYKKIHKKLRKKTVTTVTVTILNEKLQMRNERDEKNEPTLCGSQRQRRGGVY